MNGKRRFGRVRRLPSGRFQARYLGPDGKDRPAPDTFATKTEAEVWLTRKEIEIRDSEWIDPDLGKVAFETYATWWIRDPDAQTTDGRAVPGFAGQASAPVFRQPADGRDT